ncbi:hypothetical protein Hanom_Chr15g01368441 [Helianthus anomalus]
MYLLYYRRFCKIFELTTPRVGLARPLVGYYFYLLQLSFSSAQYPFSDMAPCQPSILVILRFGCELGLGELW